MESPTSAFVEAGLKSLPFSPTTTVCVAAAVEVIDDGVEDWVLDCAAARAAPVRSKAEVRRIVKLFSVERGAEKRGEKRGIAIETRS